jgi:hypothetical protein
VVDVRKDALGVFPFGQQKEAGITVGKVPREASKIRVVFSFAGVEAEIFQENDLAGRVG